MQIRHPHGAECSILGANHRETQGQKLDTVFSSKGPGLGGGALGAPVKKRKALLKDAKDCNYGP